MKRSALFISHLYIPVEKNQILMVPLHKKREGWYIPPHFIEKIPFNRILKILRKQTLMAKMAALKKNELLLFISIPQID
jgi:hypothetical protein